MSQENKKDEKWEGGEKKTNKEVKKKGRKDLN